MPRLRHVSPADPGWTRVRRGRGFSYLDETGARLPPSDTERCKQLVIPPAWTQVWICPHPNGHVQAVGTDDAGRRQYLYHEQWRERRDRDKFDHMLDFAAALPQARCMVAQDLATQDKSQRFACAIAFQLMDQGVFRIGSERYAEENGSYGVVSLERRHVQMTDAGCIFDYVAKSGLERSLVVSDERVCAAMQVLRSRRAPREARLLAYKDRGRWLDLSTDEVSRYLKELLDRDCSAKDFRTWHANVLAAAWLSSRDTGTIKQRDHAKVEVMQVVAEFLGNTPAVTKSSYVDPRILELFDAGHTVARPIAERAMPEVGATPHPDLEAEVRQLLGHEG